MIKDYTKLNLESDHVFCCNCETEMYVDFDTDVCPHCKKKGCLMDITSE